MQTTMTLYELTKKYGSGRGEETMWNTVAAVSEAVEASMPEDHRKALLRKVYSGMSNGHYNEEFAEEDIKKMYYVDRAGKRHEAPFWPAQAVKEIYETVKGDIRPYNVCDFNVTMNMMAAGHWALLEKWFPGMTPEDRNAKTVELAVNWLNDPDSPHAESKIWNYLNK